MIARLTKVVRRIADRIERFCARPMVVKVLCLCRGQIVHSEVREMTPEEAAAVAEAMNHVGAAMDEVSKALDRIHPRQFRSKGW